MPPTTQGDSTNAKQLIVERIRQSTNILVAVSANPSIDALAAALALTVVLNKVDKHATAVFSGQVPPVMQFLNPDKTFENNVDSLRDFIISLDKEKADRLRYKLEKDVVRIFITPYRTTISEKDLQFSQGDFNVDLIIALGVEKREDLDAAVVAHGRILHDAAVVTVNSNAQQSTLGAVDWHDPNASSLCEMLVSLTEALQKPGLLDAQIATALLTGIVAATDRFSNQHTTPRVMTMAAQLMAAGANQQLIAVNIQPAEGIQPLKEVKAEQEPVATKDGQLNIAHDEIETPAKAPPEPEAKAEAELDAALQKPAEPPVKALDSLKAELDAAAEAAQPPAAEPKEPPHKFMAEAPATEDGVDGIEQPEDKESAINASSWQERHVEAPSATAGGAAATSPDALAMSAENEEEERNSKILSHHTIQPLPEQQHPQPPVAAPLPDTLETPPTLTPAAESAAPAEPAPVAGDQPKLNTTDIDAARKIVDNVYATQPFDPAGHPDQAIGAQPMPAATDEQPYIPLQPNVPPPMNHGITIQPPSQPTTVMPPTEVGGLPVIPPMPALPIQEPGMPPPMPPSLPPASGEALPPADPNQPPADPGQFKIPGQ